MATIQQSKITSRHARRAFIRLALTGAAAVALAACSQSPLVSRSQPRATAGVQPDPDIELKLTAVPRDIAILPGATTRVWMYEAELIKGESTAVQAIPQSWLGPIIRARTGQHVRVHFTNQLPDGQPSIIHWHGLVLPEAMDGHPRDAIAPGQTYTYDFNVVNPAGMAWFHPHPHGQTAAQVYQGLAGLFLVTDTEEQALSLPTGDADIPLVIQDRTFGTDNQLVYTATEMAMGGTNGMGGMLGMQHGSSSANTMGGSMEAMMGQLSQQIVVNGRPDFTLSVGTRPYRLRFLNGSNARIYKLAWGNALPMSVIATDGGLLERPVVRPYVMLAPGERVEVWADFSTMTVGTTISLESLAFEGAEDPGGTGMSMQGNVPALGAPMQIATVRVERVEETRMTVPERLSTRAPLAASAAVNAANPRTVRLTLNGMQWQLNGRSFEMDGVHADETVQLGALEQWQFSNERNPGAMMDANGMAHPMHIHGVQFQVIGRAVAADLQAGWESVREGLIDEGWKDTVLVMPGERVTMLAKFEHYPGTFVYHCHNLEHSDGGMMRNYRIVA